MSSKDLLLIYQKEHGEYPMLDYEYIEWLEEWLIKCLTTLNKIQELNKQIQ
jgi:hypothetical protein